MGGNVCLTALVNAINQAHLLIAKLRAQHHLPMVEEFSSPWRHYLFNSTMSTPQLTTVTYDGATIFAQWDPLSTIPQSFTLQAVPDPASGGNVESEPNISAMTTMGTITLANPLSTACEWDVSVGAVDTSGTTWSQALRLINVQPTLVQAIYDGTQVFVTWGGVQGASVAAASFTVTIYTASGGQTLTKTVAGADATSVVVPVPTPLAPVAGNPYLVRVCANTSYGTSTCMTPVQLNTALPTGNNVIYNGTSVHAFWQNPSSPLTAQSGTTVNILNANGAVLYTGSVTNAVTTDLSVDIPVPLLPTEQYYIQIVATTATGAATGTVPELLESSLPILTNALLTDNGGAQKISGSWEPIPYPDVPISGYQLVFTSATGASKTDTVDGQYADTLTADVSTWWDSTTKWQVCVATIPSGIVQARSASVDLISLAPVLNGIVNNVSSLLTGFTNSASGATPATSYDLLVVDANQHEIYNSTIPTPEPTQGTVRLPSVQAFVEGQAYYSQVVARLNNGVAVAASDTVQFPVTVPELAYATLSDRTLTVFWSYLTGSGLMGTPSNFSLLVSYADGSVAFETTGISAVKSDGTVTLDPMPAAGTVLRLQVRANYAGSVSSASVLAPLLLEVPVIQSVNYQDDTCIVTWEGVADSHPEVRSYTVYVFNSSGQSMGSGSVATSSATNVSFGLPASSLTASDTYTVVVEAAATGNVNARSASQNLLFETVAVTGASYDGSFLDVTIDTPTGNYSGFEVQVLSGSNVIETWTLTTTTGRIPVELRSDVAYTVIAHIVEGANTGPAGIAADIMTAIPVIESIVFDAQSGETTVTWPSVAAAVDYSAQVWLEDKLEPITPSVSGTTATIPSGLNTWQSYTVKVAAVGDAGSGPYSQAGSIITATVLIEQVDYDGDITVSWQALLGQVVDGYQVNFNPSSGAVESHSVGGLQWSGSAPSGTGPFTVTVQALNDKATGPAGTAVNLLNSTIGSVTATYQNGILEALWPAISDPGVTGYELAIMSGLSVVASMQTDSKSGSIAIDLGSATTYGVSVRTLGANTAGPRAGATTLITQAPQLLQAMYGMADATGENETVIVDFLASAGATGYNVDLLQGDIVVQSWANEQPTLISGIEYKLALEATLVPGSINTIRLTPVAEDVTGPASNALPLISDVVTGVKSSVGPVGTRIEWDALPEEVASYYVVNITDGSSAPVAHTVSGNSLALSVVGAGPVTFTISAYSDVAQGPQSEPYPLLVVGSSVPTVAYDGEVVVASWVASGTDGVDGYIAGILDGTTVVEEASVNEKRASFNIALNPAGDAYSLALRDVDGTSIGPWGSGAPLVVQPPQITSTSVVLNAAPNTYDITVNFDRAAVSSASAAALYADGEPVTAAWTNATNSSTCTVVLDAWKRYTVGIKGTTANSTGPESEQTALVVVAPEITALNYSGSLLSASWEEALSPAVSGYLITVYSTPVAGGAQTVVDTYHSDSNSFSVAVTLNDSTVNYQIGLQALGDGCTGPMGAQTAIITDLVSVDAVSYDGNTLAGSWIAASANSQIAAYEMGLFAGTELLETVAGNGLEADLTATLNTAGTYTVQLRGIISPGVSGPWGTSVPVMLAAPILDVCDFGFASGQSGAATCKVTWPAVTGATSYKATIFVGGVDAQIPVTYAGLQATFDATFDPSKPYEVVVQAIQGTSTGPASSPLPVVVSVPDINTITYDGTDLTVDFQPVVDPRITAYLITVSDTTSTQVTTVVKDTTVVVLQPDFGTGDVATVSVSALAGIARGSASAPVSVIDELLVVAIGRYDGAQITASWSTATDSTIVSYELGLFNGEALVQSSQFSDVSGLLNTVLDADVPSTLRVRGRSTSNSVGPWGTAFILIPGAPVLTAASFVFDSAYSGAGSFTVSWNQVAGATSYNAMLLVEGANTIVVPSSLTTATIPSNFDATGLYKVVVQAYNGTSYGPLSEDVAVVVSLPSVNSVSYDGTNLTVDIEPVVDARVSSYTVAVRDSAGGLITQELQDTTVAILQPAFDTGVQAEVTVVANAGMSTGAVSEPFSVVDELIGLTGSTYDGAQVTATWNSASDASITSYELGIFNGDSLLTSGSFDDLAGVLDASLDTSVAATLRVRGRIGTNSVGPWGAAQPITTAVPPIVSTSYQPGAGSTFDFSVNAQSPPAGYTLHGRLLHNGIDTGAVPTVADDFLIFDGPLNQIGSYTVEAWFAQGTNIGPNSVQAPAVLDVPQIETVVWDGTTITATISDGVYPDGTTFSVWLRDAGSALVQQVHTDALQVSMTPEFDTGSEWSLLVFAQRGVGSGLQSAAVPVVLDIVGIGVPTFDGAAVTVNWDLVSDPNVTAYELGVFDDKELIESVTASAGNAAVAFVADPGVTYHVQVRPWIGKQSAGAWSAMANIFNRLPIITLLENGSVGTPDSFTVTWTTPSGSNGETPQLYENGNPISSTPTLDTNSATWTGLLDTQNTYSVAVRGESGGSIGPLSPPVRVVESMVQIDSVAWDGTNLTVGWAGITSDALSGYEVSVYDDSTGNLLKSTQVNTTMATLQPELGGTGDAYYVVVRAHEGQSFGPQSDQVYIVQEPLTVTASSYTGGQLDGTWATSSESRVNTYKMGVFDGSTLVTSTLAGGSEGALALLADPDVDYALKVQPWIDGVSAGPWSDPQQLMTQIPLITSIVLQPGLPAPGLTATWNSVPGATSMDAVLLENGTSVQPVGFSGLAAIRYMLRQLIGHGFAVNPFSIGLTQATWNITLDPWKEYKVVVTAEMNGSTGPASLSAPVLVAVPQIESVEWDNTNLSVSWQGVPDVEALGYQVSVFPQGGTTAIMTQSVEGTSVVLQPEFDTGSTYEVRVQTLSNNCVGSLSNPVVIITDEVAVATTSYNEIVLSSSWSTASQPEVGNYELGVFEGSALLRTVKTESATAAIGIALPGSGISTRVRCLGTNSVGAWSAPMQVISTAPAVTAIDYSKVGGNWVMVVQCKEVATATGYWVHVYEGNVLLPMNATWAVAGVGTGIRTFTVTFAAGTGLPTNKTITLHISARDLNHAVQGPYSTLEEVIAAPPVLETYSYNAGTLQVGWHPINQDVVSGYTVQLLGETGEVATVDVATNYAELSYTMTPGTAYTLEVQAVGALATGPVSTAVDPNLPDTSLYFSTPVTDVVPYVYRQESQPPTPNYAFELYLPQLFVTPPATIPEDLNPVGTGSNENTPFRLLTTSNAALPYKISVAKDSDCWLFAANDPGIRTTLQSDYSDFMQALEAVTGGLLPGALAYVQAAIARGLPLSYSEQLYYAYGFDASNRYASLQPGMRVRIDYEQYQFTGPGQTTPLLDGMVGNGTSYFELGEYIWTTEEVGGATTTMQETGFSAFMSNLRDLTVNTNEGGGAGLFDLYISGYRMPYYRVFYPTTIASADTAGSIGTSSNVMLVAAPTFEKMEEITTAYTGGQPLPSGTAAMWFRGRTAIVPEVSIAVNGVQHWVAVGSTLRQVLDRVVTSPLRAPAGSTGPVVAGIRVMRSTDNVFTDLTDVDNGYVPARQQEIMIGYSGLATYSDGTDYLDVPVLAGDEITTNYTAGKS